MHTRILPVALLLAALVPILSGCAGMPLSVSSRTSTVQLPASLLDENASDNQVFAIAANPDSNRQFTAWYENGQKKMEYIQDRGVIIDIFGRVVGSLESQRYNRLAAELDRLEMLAIQQFLPRYDAAVDRRNERDANPQNNTLLTAQQWLEAMQALRSQSP